MSCQRGFSMYCQYHHCEWFLVSSWIIEWFAILPFVWCVNIFFTVLLILLVHVWFLGIVFLVKCWYCFTAKMNITSCSFSQKSSDRKISPRKISPPRRRSFSPRRPSRSPGRRRSKSPPRRRSRSPRRRSGSPHRRRSRSRCVKIVFNLRFLIIDNNWKGIDEVLLSQSRN